MSICCDRQRSRTAQDADPSNFGGFSLSVLVSALPQPPRVVLAPTAVSWVSDSQCVASRSVTSSCFCVSSSYFDTLSCHSDDSSRPL
jgi:hypothetical protein